MTAQPSNRRIPASLHAARGFALALNTIEAALDQVEDDCLTEDQVRFKNSLYDLLNELMPDDDGLKLQPTNRELAKKYAVSPRSITNWRREGCPFERGQWKVLRWMTKRRYVPAGAKAKFARQLQRRLGSQELGGWAKVQREALEVFKIARNSA